MSKFASNNELVGPYSTGDKIVSRVLLPQQRRIIVTAKNTEEIQTPIDFDITQMSQT